MKTIFSKIGLGLLLSLALISCGPGESTASEQGDAEARPDQQYAMVVFTKGAEYFNWTYAGMVDAAKAIGPHVKTELQGPAEWDASLEARTVEQMVAKQVDALLVASADEATLVPAINRAIDAGIPVIAFDSDSPDSKRLMFVGTDNYSFGWTAGMTMGEWLDGNGEVAISTVPGMGALEERSQGFIDALAENYTGIRVAAVLNDEGEVAKAETQVSAALQSNPQIRGVFTTHGYGGPGAAAAVRNVGRQGDVHVMAVDFGGPVIELLKAGEIRGTVIDDPYLIGYYAMLSAYAAANPSDVPSQNPPFGHVPPLIYGGASVLTADADPKLFELFENPPTF